MADPVFQHPFPGVLQSSVDPFGKDRCIEQTISAERASLPRPEAEGNFITLCNKQHPNECWQKEGEPALPSPQPVKATTSSQPFHVQQENGLSNLSATNDRMHSMKSFTAVKWQHAHRHWWVSVPLNNMSTSRKCHGPGARAGGVYLGTTATLIITCHHTWLSWETPARSRDHHSWGQWEIQIRPGLATAPGLTQKHLRKCWNAHINTV